MGTTTSEVVEYLGGLGVEHEILDEEQGLILTKHYVSRYINPNDAKEVDIYILLRENGELIDVFAANLYSYADGPHKMAVLQTCLMVCWKSKMLQYEYNLDSGEIRAVIEFPLMDAHLTELQLRRVLFDLRELIDRFDPAMRCAVQKGEIDFAGTDSDADALAKLAEDLDEVELDDLPGILAEIRKRKGTPDQTPPDRW